MNESTPEPSESDVLTAASAIVDAFAATDTQSYFSRFAEDASFVFHPEARRLNTRAEYEREWASWLADDWSVAACASSDQLVQTFPGGAVFSHTVDTTVNTADGRESYRERESIVFRRLGDGELIAIHEHLSTVPDPADGSSPTEAGAAESATDTEEVAQ